MSHDKTNQEAKKTGGQDRVRLTQVSGWSVDFNFDVKVEAKAETGELIGIRFAGQFLH